jgi:hypothetical protein
MFTHHGNLLDKKATMNQIYSDVIIHRAQFHGATRMYHNVILHPQEKSNVFGNQGGIHEIDIGIICQSKYSSGEFGAEFQLETEIDQVWHIAQKTDESFEVLQILTCLDHGWASALRSAKVGSFVDPKVWLAGLGFVVVEPNEEQALVTARSHLPLALGTAERTVPCNKQTNTLMKAT